MNGEFIKVLRSAFNQVPDCIIILNKNDEIVYVNNAMLSLFNYSCSDEVLNRHISEFFSNIYYEYPLKNKEVCTYTTFEFTKRTGEMFEGITTVSPLLYSELKLMIIRDMNAINEAKTKGLKEITAYIKENVGLVKYVFTHIGPSPEASIDVHFLKNCEKTLAKIGIYYMSTIQFRTGLYGPFPIAGEKRLLSIAYSFQLDINETEYPIFDDRLKDRLLGMFVMIFPRELEPFFFNRNKLRNIFESALRLPEIRKPGKENGELVLRYIKKTLFEREITTEITFERKLNIIEQILENYEQFDAVEDIFEYICQIAEEVLAFKRITLWQLDREKKGLVLRQYRGYKGLINKDMVIRLSDRSIVARCARTKSTQNIPDVSKDPDYLEADPAVKSELAVPIIAPLDKKVVGVINIEAEEPNAYKSEDELVLMLIAQKTALIMETEEVETRFYALKDLITRLSQHKDGDMEKIFDEVTEFVQETYDFGYFSILTYDEKEGKLVVRKARGYSDIIGRKISLNPPEGIVGRCGATLETQLVKDVSKDKDYIAVNESIQSELAIPILYNTKLLGVINIESEEVNYFDTTDKRIMEIIATIIAPKLLAEKSKA